MVISTCCPAFAWMRALAVIMGAMLACAAARPPPSSLNRDLEGLASSFRTAVLSRDVDALLAFVGPNGMPCEDGLISKDGFAADLRADSHLRGFFRAIERALRAGARLDVRVPNPHPRGTSSACVLVSDVQGKVLHTQCFEKRGGRWLFSGPDIC